MVCLSTQLPSTESRSVIEFASLNKEGDEQLLACVSTVTTAVSVEWLSVMLD